MSVSNQLVLYTGAVPKTEENYCSIDMGKPYRILPSTFSYPVAIIKFALEHCLLAKIEIDKKRGSFSEYCKHVPIGMLKLAGCVMLGSAVNVVALSIVPVTIGLDVGVGVVECGLAWHEGRSFRAIKDIAHCKLLACPVQQILFFAPLILPTLYLFVLTIRSPKSSLLLAARVSAMMFWSLQFAIVCISQDRLPKLLKHPTVNIMEFGHERGGHDEWKKSLRKQVRDAHLKKFTDSRAPEEYKAFKQRLAKGYTARGILGLDSYCTKEEMLQTYQKMSLIVHPDRNIERKEEATKLFNILGWIKTHIEDEIDGKPKGESPPFGRRDPGGV